MVDIVADTTADIEPVITMGTVEGIIVRATA
jgi:hypothetical protein